MYGFFKKSSKLYNTFNYFCDNAYTLKRLFKSDSCSIGFSQLANKHEVLCNNALLLKVINYCCIVLHVKCLQKSWIWTLFPENFNNNFFHKQRSFTQAKTFPGLKKCSRTRDISMIKEAFHKQVFLHNQRSFQYFFFSRNILFIIKDVFQNQWSFPQAKIFPWSNNFFTRKTFHNQGSFPQAKIFSWSRNFLTRKGFTFVEYLKS